MAGFVSAARQRVRSMLLGLGYRVYRVGGPLDPGSMDQAMAALRQRGHRPATVVDIGASNGSWTASLMRHFPDARYLLIEAQPVHEAALRDFCARHRNVQFVLAAAGERDGRIYFDASEPLSGQASETPFPSNSIEVPVVTLDSALREKALAGPYLLKFDTHGFELPILKGAEATLAKTDAIVMECYNFRIAPQALLFHEMCAWLGERGFRCVGLADPMHRPYDGAFWQMDLVFVRSGRPEFGYASYR